MKKNKTIAFMLAATLLVGGTFLGTKAWFTDTATVDNSLVVTMGSFDLVVTENSQEEGEQIGGWELVRTGDQESKPEGNVNGTKNTNFTNIRPGDYFTKTYTIKNNGSLDQKLTIDNILQEEDIDKYKLTVDEISKSKNYSEFETGMILKSEETRKFSLKLEPKHTYWTGTKSEKESLINLPEKVMKIEAEQINAPAGSPTPLQ